MNKIIIISLCVFSIWACKNTSNQEKQLEAAEAELKHPPNYDSLALILSDTLLSKEGYSIRLEKIDTAYFPTISNDTKKAIYANINCDAKISELIEVISEIDFKYLNDRGYEGLYSLLKGSRILKELPFQRVDSITLALKLENGTEVRLRDSGDSTNQFQYEFGYFIPQINCFAVKKKVNFENDFYQEFRVVLVNRENGEMIEIWNYPVFSQKNKKFVAISKAGGYLYSKSPNGIQLFSYNSSSINLDFDLHFEIEPTNVQWINEDWFELEFNDSGEKSFYKVTVNK